MATRLTRAEQKDKTRTNVVAAARQVFLRRGFHGATLDEIADEAGYTKGAVYSNFAGKDDLFLAVLDDYYERQTQTYRERVAEIEDFEVISRAVARLFLRGVQMREPGWTPLVTEFMAHAARRESLRGAVIEVRERFLDAIGELIEELAARTASEFRVPPREVARASGAMMRGLAVERLLDPEGVSAELFEELHAALMRGLTQVDGRGT